MVDSRNTLTQAILKDTLSYDPDIGVFRWGESCKIKPKAGKLANNISNGGYVYIQFGGIRYLAHRLAWLYVHGEWPDGEVDHINHVRYDNRILNLRVVDHRENQKNKPMQSNNTSGFTGVFWNKRAGKWGAVIQKDGRPLHLGFHVDKVDAIAAREAAKIECGYHENHGRSVI